MCDPAKVPTNGNRFFQAPSPNRSFVLHGDEKPKNTKLCSLPNNPQRQASPKRSGTCQLFLCQIYTLDAQTKRACHTGTIGDDLLRQRLL
ncbi:hypothetical protein SAMN05444358_1011744 [Ruegeria halocynthiae]|uniref:Uncharacterized protein n=1 Tax=Ruegeria halocynthiae TaxID=985054 RepID=A0A1H2WCL1_9RHOB|nr:hypothetical protein SAMN05444358_1011744 [Ruegeria halocynthiae]